MAGKQRKSTGPSDEALEKGLPANIDAERFVLGSVMLDDSLYPQVAGTLKADAFSEQRHRTIFARMGELHDRGERIDRVTVANELMKFSEIESCGGLSYLVSLDEGLPHIPNVDAYVRIVKQKADLRRIVSVAQHMMNRALVGEESPEQIVTGARESLVVLGSDETAGGPQTPLQIIEALPGGMNEFLSPPPTGLLTGYHKFDEMTSGLHPGDLTLLAARPSVGKTALALNIAQHVTMKLGKTAMIFSLEMSKTALLHRMLCAEARVDSQRFRQGYLSVDERRRLAEATAKLAAANLYVDDKSAATAADMHARVRRRMAEAPVDLVVVDYLQLMAGSGNYENKNQEVTAISRGLKLAAMELQLPFLVLSQLSRAVETRKGGGNRPQLSDLRESGSLEQDADLVGFIYRPEMYSRDREDLRGVAELILAKQRNGPVGTVNLVYIHSQTKFENRAEDVGDSAIPPMLEPEYAPSNF